jgi:uncharacterized repeat protein (TIGR04076 family)
MFQVKATVIGFAGDEEKYPCHFQHKVGDVFIWDGEKFIGRICPYAAGAVIPKMLTMASVGPRLISPRWFLPFWYAPVSRKDPGQKKYDGLGFRNVLETIQEPPYHIASLQPPGAFTWPPQAQRTVAQDDVVMCGDSRTLLVVKVEAFDLSDKGDATPYFRREMTILHKVSAKPGIAVDRILGEFTKEEIEIPYPALGEVMVEALVEELELMGYLEVKDGKAYVTGKGAAKLDAFKQSLPAQDRAALNMGARGRKTEVRRQKTEVRRPKA